MSGPQLQTKALSIACARALIAAQRCSYLGFDIFEDGCCRYAEILRERCSREDQNKAFHGWHNTLCLTGRGLQRSIDIYKSSWALSILRSREWVHNVAWRKRIPSIVLAALVLWFWNSSNSSRKNCVMSNPEKFHCKIL